MRSSGRRWQPQRLSLVLVVVALASSSCVLYSWGSNDLGQLGVGSDVDQASPGAVGSSDDWDVASAGRLHSCGISEGQLYCWGFNGDYYLYRGTVGDGTQYHRESPVRVGLGDDWVDVAAGGDLTCAIYGPGSMWCWGDPYFEQPTGDGQDHFDGYRSPQQVGQHHDWTAVTAGKHHACGIRGEGSEATAWCWGRNDSGQLGAGTVTEREAVPVQVGQGYVDGWIDIDAGGSHTCGIRPVPPDDRATVYCWGSGAAGQLGLGDNTDRSFPTGYGSLDGWTSVSAGGGHTCALRPHDGESQLWCWGANDHGELGLGDHISRNVPVRVGTATNWSEISAGGRQVAYGGGNFDHYGFTCGRRNGSVYCWGRNNEGQLGDGTLIDKDTPTLSHSGTGWVSVSAGGSHVLGRRTE